MRARQRKKNAKKKHACSLMFRRAMVRRQIFTESIHYAVACSPRLFENRITSTLRIVEANIQWAKRMNDLLIQLREIS